MALYTLLQVLFTLFIFLFIAALGNEIINSDEVVEEADDFDVFPGGEVHTFEQEKEGVKCKFTYSAQGGTKEKWLFMMSHTPDKKRFHCNVERPDGNSYLFFMTFSLSMEGATVKQADVTGKNFADLSEAEFTIEDSAVKNTDAFKNSLGSILLTGVRSKTEL